MTLRTKCHACDKNIQYQIVPEGTCGELYACNEHLSQAVDQCVAWDAQTLVSRGISSDLAAAHVTPSEGYDPELRQRAADKHNSIGKIT
jgi:hypothetical protein